MLQKRQCGREQFDTFSVQKGALSMLLESATFRKGIRESGSYGGDALPCS